MASRSKGPMTENEKKAKLTALRDANSMAKKAMQDSLSFKKKDSPELKKHTSEMSEDMKMNLDHDSESIEDPTHNGNIVGRHVSDENIDRQTESDSVYNIDELDAKIKSLLEQKSKLMKKG